MTSERVVFVTTSFPETPGDAAGHFVEAEARGLQQRGVRVQVIAPGASRRIGDVEVLGVEHHGAFGWPGALSRIRSRPTCIVGAAAFVHGARARLARLPHDRVVAHFLVPSAFPIATISAAPLEIVAHGSDVRVFARLPRTLRSRMARAWLGRSVEVRCVSAELATELLRTAPELAERVRVEPARVDVSGVPSRSEARRAHGVDASDARLVLLATRLVPEKRVDVALAALELVPDVRVVVLGDGPSEAVLRARFPTVTFLGRRPRSEALSWIRAADLVLSASRREGAPSVVREARALGVPVVCPVVGDLAAWAERDPDLWLVA